MISNSLIRQIRHTVFRNRAASYLSQKAHFPINFEVLTLRAKITGQQSQFSTMAQAGKAQLAGGPVQPQRINSNLYCLSRTTLANFNRFLSKAVDTQTLTFNQTEAEINSGNILLIDVREKDECTNDGKIPTSKNIPLGELATGIKLENREFQEKYGFEKPKAAQKIVVHCRKGPRAFNAASILKYGGYTDVRVYTGILDWKENGGKLESP